MKYYIGVDNLRKLVVKYAASGLMKPIERPKSGIQSKNNAHDGPKRAQKLLITWIADYPKIYPQIKPYVTTEDFTEELYQQVAQKLFERLESENGAFSPAEIINTFDDEEKQKEAATLFYEELPPMETTQEKEQALRDVIYAVKKNSLEHFKQMQEERSIEAVSKVIEGKKALLALQKVHFTLD